MPRKYVDPLVRKIERSKRETKVSNAKIAKALGFDERTLYRRFRKPENFTVFEIEMLGDLFHWQPWIVRKFIG
jgi:methylphosphotriester-DNA--protein-cysteine methyltransferase